jgi:hypothetical protein
MTWFTWRQFRTQTWITAGALVALGVLLVIAGRSIADAYAAAGVAGCDPNCDTAIDNFLRQAKSGIGGTVHGLANAIMYVLPALIGIFWGAPLIARELETGTHRLAWNQSVTRTRWLATKLTVIGAAVAATAGLLSWVVTAWAARIDQAAGDRITPLVYGARGIVPVGYALFAFTLGITAGVLIRRTVPAMAATLAGYAAVAFAMTAWIRALLVPASRATPGLDMSMFEAIMINPEDNTMSIVGGNLPSSAWILSNETITPTGEAFAGSADGHCGPEYGQQVCTEWIDSLGLRLDIAYHPASHFWPLQWAETGILLALTVLLAGFCFWWVRRRLT